MESFQFELRAESVLLYNKEYLLYVCIKHVNMYSVGNMTSLTLNLLRTNLETMRS